MGIPHSSAFHTHFPRMTLRLPLAEWGSPQSCSHPLRQSVTFLPHSKGKLSAGFGYYQVWGLGAGDLGLGDVCHHLDSICMYERIGTGFRATHQCLLSDPLLSVQPLVEMMKSLPGAEFRAAERYIPPSHTGIRQHKAQP